MFNSNVQAREPKPQTILTQRHSGQMCKALRNEEEEEELHQAILVTDEEAKLLPQFMKNVQSAKRQVCRKAV